MRILLFLLILVNVCTLEALSRNIPWWKTQQNRGWGKRVPYYAEFRYAGHYLVFRGYVLLQNEPKIRMMQTNFLENLDSPHVRDYYMQELEFLGVTVEEIYDNPNIPTEKLKPAYPPTQSVH